MARSPRPRVRRTTMWVLRTDLAPLQEQHMLLIAELSLQPKGMDVFREKVTSQGCLLVLRHRQMYLLCFQVSWHFHAYFLAIFSSPPLPVPSMSSSPFPPSCHRNPSHATLVFLTYFQSQFTQCDFQFNSLFCKLNDFIFLYDLIKFHCVYGPHFHYLSGD